MTYKELVRSVFYWSGSRKVVQTMVGPLRGPVSILLYHRVLPESEYYAQTGPNRVLAVTTQRFEEHLQYLKAHYDIITIENLRDRIVEPVKKHAVVLTFDDGYLDNKLHALPLLNKYKLPATIYPVTGFLDGECTPWWDQLWTLCTRLKIIDFEWSGRRYSWSLAKYRDKESCFRQLGHFVNGLDYLDRKRLFTIIQAGRFDVSDANHLLTWDDLSEMADNPLITVGAHANTHTAFKSLTSTQVTEELVTCKTKLEHILARPITHFSYPFGATSTASSRDFRIVKELGFHTAVMTTCKNITATRLWDLPRHPINQTHTTGHLQTKLSGWSTVFRRNI